MEPSDQPSYDQVRKLLSACEQGSLTIVENLLEQGINVDTTDEEEFTPLQVNLFLNLRVNIILRREMAGF